jgi:hypothetical protein
MDNSIPAASTADSGFVNELAAASFLLAESTTTLHRHGVQFVVVGGWSPYLFHAQPFGHPGTYDVDVLLHTDSLGDGSFERASEELLVSGYLRAPKNVFQAHRVLKVHGESFVFHVDFLNEKDPGGALELVSGKGRMKSVYTKAMKAVFKYKNYRYHPSVPGIAFPSPESFVVTKAPAVAVKKRKRDAFDIFLTIRDQPNPGFRAKWQYLSSKDGLFSDATDALRIAVNEGDALEKIEGVFSEMQEANQLRLRVPDRQEIRDAFSFLEL